MGNLVGGVFGLAGYWYLRHSGVPFAVMVTVFAWAVGIVAVGWLVGRVMSNKVDCDSTSVQAVCWTQLAAWAFPPIGLFLSAASWELAEGSASHALKMRMLSIVGLLATALNFGIGLLMQFGAAAA